MDTCPTKRFPQLLQFGGVSARRFVVCIDLLCMYRDYQSHKTNKHTCRKVVFGDKIKQSFCSYTVSSDIKIDYNLVTIRRSNLPHINLIFRG